MEGLQPPPNLQFTGNVAENWRKFRQRFEFYLAAIGADEKSEKTKASVFLHVVGDEALEAYNNFTFDTGEDKMKLEKITEKFESYCAPKRNVTLERHKFFTRAQETGETVDQYVTELKKRSRTCEFGGLTDSLIKDRLVCGIPDDSLRERLLGQRDLDLEKALVLCRAAETVREDTHRAVKKKSTADEAKKGMKPANRDGQGKACGTHHPPKRCPAYGKMHSSCSKIKRFAQCCKTQTPQSKESKSEPEELYLDVVAKNEKGEKDWLMTLKVSDIHLTRRLDDGAETGVTPEDVLEKIRPELQATETEVRGNCGSETPEKGKRIEAESGEKIVAQPWPKWANASPRETEADVSPEPKTREEFLKHSCEITLDPDTVNTWLSLSDGDRRATLMRDEQPHPGHPDRFVRWRQVLSRQSLTGRCYWEVEWRKKRVVVAVAYKNIGRAGAIIECAFGFSDKSWALECNCSSNSFKFIHNSIKTHVSGPWTSRVGVFLDHDAGLLSFYSVAPESTTLLHRVQTRFSEPLHAGLWFSGYNGATGEFCQLK